MPTWADIQRGIFAGESGGDYGALYGFANRPGKMFSDVDVTGMTINELLDFQSPRGEYGNYVSALNEGVTSTPAGAYQIVGRTLRDARDRMGLTGGERFTPEMQDRIGRWIYDQQGTGAWEGYQGPQGGDMAYTDQPTQQGGLLSMTEPSRGDKRRDMAGRAAMFFNELRQRPSAAIPQMVQGRRDERKANRTAEWLAQQPGGEQYAAMIAAGATGAQALQAYQAAMAGPKPTAAAQNYAEYNRILQEKGPEAAAQFLAMAKSGSTTNISTGTIPPGYQQITDPVTGAVSMIPIPGGPIDVENRAAAEAEGLKAGLEDRSATIVLEDIAELSKIVEESLIPVTGVGSLLKYVPGTNSLDASALIDTIAGNIGFDRLQQMRDASPTGGALGAISEKELIALQSVMGSLSQSQSKNQFLRSLGRLEQIYTSIMEKAAAYPNATTFGYSGGAQDDFTVTGKVGSGG